MAAGTPPTHLGQGDDAGRRAEQQPGPVGRDRRGQRPAATASAVSRRAG